MKIALEIAISIMLACVLALSAVTYCKVHNQEIKEVVWLIPNDASCSDIWSAEELEVIAKKYELRKVY